MLRALRFDTRLLDRAGEEALASVVLVPAGRRVAFDDPAVQQARRDVLAGPPPDAISALMADDSSFAGMLTVRRGPRAEALLADDPFARIGEQAVVAVPAGVLGRVGLPAGPVIERHGSANPWPVAFFGGA